MKYSDIVDFTKRKINSLTYDEKIFLYNKLNQRYDDIAEYLKNDRRTLSYDSYINMRNYVISQLDSIDDSWSKVYRLDVKKIRSYNELFELILSKNVKIVNHNKTYIEYTLEIMNELNRVDIEKELYEILNFKNIKIEIEFFINYTQKDLDNLTKPFLDSLFKYSNSSDNRMKELVYSRNIKNIKDNTEYIYIRARRLRFSDVLKSSLENKYNQICWQSFI